MTRTDPDQRPATKIWPARPMTPVEIDVEHCRATGIWPLRPMTPLEPMPSLSPPRPFRARHVLDIASRLIVTLVLLGAAGGIAYVLATRQM